MFAQVSTYASLLHNSLKRGADGASERKALPSLAEMVAKAVGNAKGALTALKPLLGKVPRVCWFSYVV